MARIKTLDKREADPLIRPLYEMIESRGGRPSNFFSTVAHSPAVLQEFARWGIIRRGPLIWSIDRRLRELVQIKVSMVNQCRYCVAVHQVMAEAVGIPRSKVEALGGDGSGLTEAERAALEYAEQVTRDARHVSDELFARLKQYYTDKEIVELTTIIGLFNWYNRFNDALQVEPDPENFRQGIA